MENKGLLFIPDISGFTRFVNETEIGHSRLIIQELLEILINSNQIGLEVSEIEGDAILFYKYGESPGLDILYKQVERMFCEFHKNLLSYDYRKYCQCKACMSAIGLTLKIITHYGEFTGYKVKSFNKLIGKDVIIAHQLLKNDVEKHEYWMVTESLTGQDNLPHLTDWMKWKLSTKKIDNGEIPFHYTQLTNLKNKITHEPLPGIQLKDKIKIISFNEEYNTDIITLFHATGSFNYRHRWQEGVKKVEEVNHYLPRIGMRCRCVMDNGDAVIYSSSYSYSQNRIEFSETNEKDNSTVYYILETTDNKKTRLTITYYMEKNFTKQALFMLTRKKKLEDIYKRSMSNLAELVKEIKLPKMEE